MLSGYTLTETERKIEKMFMERNIITPSDLAIRNVANLFQIELDFSNNGPQRAIWEDDFSVIFLDPDETEENQRKIFFHELGHPILHCGDQTKNMSKKFRELQEAQANRFQLYAAIPFFMLKELELPPFEYQIIKLIQMVFKVPESLAKKRVEQIKRRILQSKIDVRLPNLPIPPTKIAEEKEQYEMETYPLLEDLFSSNEIKQYFSTKVKRKNKVYFDVDEGHPIPRWYCIEVNRGEVNWGKKMHLFPIDDEFEFLPMSEFQNSDSDAHVMELFLHPSYPNDFAINLKAIKKQLNFFNVDPYNINRMVIDANYLEHLLELNIFGNRLMQVVNNEVTNN
ncbi:ImmA/IrrE family metallo-endopeptidase [Bacillus sp. ISL-40]|uniref:ImmA/IrrE family metallo-endopeptidase n=1 Tax=unclassified Bacillus (in: firmicutes) TaxID=185979 RepID=UPI001BEA635D|nr:MULTISPECIES: ImmA/IrrE family metallo-endopeptidase [unclassified Bacillus (in: firmicutes)]MBT2696387.1 ImmA/IrrE family metallo-endopeptidase [Bacillus sp. ISL-40]MBT2743236.1 ImmA/IrrE family metallo-endopeptidase [Bacillus sp. ISL-77]